MLQLLSQITDVGFDNVGVSAEIVMPYVIEDLSDLDAVFAGFAHAKRKNIKKADDFTCRNRSIITKNF